VTNVWYDSDLLGDDLFALKALAKNNDVNIVAISSYGRRRCALERAKMANAFLSSYGINGLRIVPGQDRPLFQKPIPGCTLCDDVMSTLLEKKSNLNNVDDSHIASLDMIEKSKALDHLTLLATGPLTNIALATIIEPTFPERVDKLFLMGGCRNVQGNLRAKSEANIFNDPEAARIIFSRFKDIYVIPLDVTLKILVKKEEMESVADMFLKYIIKACMEAHRIKGQGEVMPMHDYLAALALIDESLFSFERCSIKIETSSSISRGMMVIAPDDMGNAHFAYDLEPERIMAHFLQDFGGLK